MRELSSTSHRPAIGARHTGVVGPVVKALVVALLTLPVIAYVTGSMVAARSDLPAQREPVVIGDMMDVEPQQTIATEPGRRGGQDDPDDRDDDADDADDADDDDSVSVVRPQPREIDDDADDRDDDLDDDRGHDDSGDDGD
jgi:hypothetical protein